MTYQQDFQNVLLEVCIRLKIKAAIINICMLTMDLIDIFLSKVSHEEMNLERIITQLTPSWSLELKVIYTHIWFHILLNEHQAELKKT